MGMSKLTIFISIINFIHQSQSMAVINSHANTHDKLLPPCKDMKNKSIYPTPSKEIHSTPTLHPSLTNRRKMIQTTFFFSTLSLSSSSSSNAINIPEQKSYSSNARNMERLNSGDASGGSTYNNNPGSPTAAKRRAMVGCKVSSSRVEASKVLLDDNDDDIDGKKKKRQNISVMSEKDCNMKVMGGETEFMLKALRNLDCPTCPYGIEGA